jgi:Fe-S-cluster containining protein
LIELHIPEGINYECTGCGKCCSGWAVPMTQEDYERISAADWSSLHESFGTRTLFRQLSKREYEGTPYTHKIVSDTGICPFLVDNLCYMHKKHGAEFKPSICQLFPYCFSETPSGIYATVSFVSAGVIYNSGKPLLEQRDYLEGKWQEFRKMYPDYKPDWSHTKLTVDQPISWEEYLAIEKRLLAELSDTSRPLGHRMLACSQYLMSQVKRPAGAPATTSDTTIPAADARLSLDPLNALDKSLLLTFQHMYFPVKQLRRGEGDFRIPALLQQHFLGSKAWKIAKESHKLEELQVMTWPEDDKEINGILERYIYSYVFGKKYFGAGFGQVSVIAGFHHLVLILALIKLQSKASARARGGSVNVLDVATTVRQTERQVGESKLGGYAAAAWELLLFPPGRARRMLGNC